MTIYQQLLLFLWGNIYWWVEKFGLLEFKHTDKEKKVDGLARSINIKENSSWNFKKKKYNEKSFQRNIWLVSNSFTQNFVFMNPGHYTSKVKSSKEFYYYEKWINRELVSRLANTRHDWHAILKCFLFRTLTLKQHHFDRRCWYWNLKSDCNCQLHTTFRNSLV